MTGIERLLKWLVACAIALTLIITGRQLWTTDLGMDDWMVDGRRMVTEVDPEGAADRAGIAVGDEILEDPGLITFVEPWTEREVYEWNYRLHVAFESGHVRVRIRRGGVDADVDVQPDPAPSFSAVLRQLRRMGPNLPASFAFLGVAALLARRSSRAEKDDRARRIVAASCALFGPCFVIQAPQPAWPLWLYPLSSLIDNYSGASGVTLLALFTWSYPARSRLAESARVRRAVVVSGVVACTFSIANSMHLIGGIPQMLHGNALALLYDSVLAIATVVGLVVQRRAAVDVVTRRQTNWLIASFGVGYVVPIVLFVFPRYVLGLTSDLMTAVLFSFLMLIPLGLAAVVSRFGLFSLDGVALRAGPYVIAVVTSLAVCIALTLGLQTLFAWRAGSGAEAARWGGIVVALLLAEPVRQGAQRLIDRAFARDRDAFLHRCSELAARLARASDARAIEADVTSALDARVARLVDLPGLLDEESARKVQRSLAEKGTLRVLDLPDPVVLDTLTALGFEILVGTSSRETSEAPPPVLALTLSVAAYRLGKPERDALALVGKVIGAALAQHAAQRALELELVRSEDERRHIAMELHDGLGATLTAARLMARRLGEPNGAPEANAAATLAALEATLRDGIGDLRTSVWSLDPGEDSWEALVARIRRSALDLCVAADVELTMHTEGELAQKLSLAGRLGLMRLIQEAVNNALKHGSPKHVDIAMRATTNTIEVSVDDDGTGISPSSTDGRGLGNMRRRIESLGGTFRIEPRAAGGTRVSAAVLVTALTVAPPAQIVEGSTP